MLEVEGGTDEWCMRILRHEAGHAIENAYRLRQRRRRVALFGRSSQKYPVSYSPRPYSKSFVQHLEAWYAQSHPDEDFAETFAVWLASSPDEWRRQYRDWKALEKLEYIEKTMRAAIRKPPRVKGGRLVADVSKAKRTLARHYAARRKLWSSDYPDFYDSDLRTIFGEMTEGDETALSFMRRHRRTIVASTVRWTGERKYTVDGLATNLPDAAELAGAKAPTTSTTTSAPTDVNTRNAPVASRRVIEPFARIWPALKLRLETTGRARSAGQAVRKPGPCGSTTVNVRATDVAFDGMPHTPRVPICRVRVEGGTPAASQLAGITPFVGRFAGVLDAPNWPTTTTVDPAGPVGPATPCGPMPPVGPATPWGPTLPGGP